MRTIEFDITDEWEGKKIRDFLRNFGVSTAVLSKIKQLDDGIMLNGKPVKAIDKLSFCDTLVIKIPEDGQMPKPLYISDVKLVYDDEDIIVFNKPSNMLIHETHGHRGDTLANAAASFMTGTAFRAVYRLDQDTTGLVVVAKNKLASCKLAGKIDKDYYAIIGKEINGEGMINAPIRCEKKHAIKRGVFEDGEKAVTYWKAVRCKDGKTLLKLNIETGRTHQIRTHMAYLGVPLLGDSMYGGDCSKINRQALHCKKIYFRHPVTEEDMVLECDFPEDFKRLWGSD